VFGEAAGFGALGIILPLAISFVTFTQLAYVIDIARGRAPERKLSRYALFVTFFPHLIAGPIMRAHEFIPQVRHPRPFRVEYVRLALPLLVGGFFKKTVGDNLSPTANHVFADPNAYSSAGLWIGVLAFTFQILLDFSGYTDMALGSAHLLGYRLPLNFNWPYRASSIQDFWRRWHMTLSRWLRDYLYIGLGGNRRGTVRTYLNLAATMLLGGLWHGANLTFIVWGGWHGSGLAVHRFWREHAGRHIRIPTVAAWAMTFGFVVVGWVFFRAESVEKALFILSRMVVPHRGAQTWALVLVGLVCVAFAFGQWPRLQAAFGRLAPEGSLRRYLGYGLAFSVAAVLVPIQTAAFIYFQF
jgi:alginate O-acetyltransferase complex protein AlgI